jgi:ABC-type antimicrobial peptide transport system permease subunit
VEIRQDYKENLRLAMDTLRAHKLRSLLTMLGVMIGVGVIIIVGALMVGFDRNLAEEISSYGADTAFVSKFGGGIRFGRLTKEERMRKPLTLEDSEAILTSCSAVQNVAVSLFPEDGTHRVRHKDREVVGIDFRGTFPSFVEVYGNAAIKHGRFFTQSENEHRQKVVVLGENAAEALFGQAERALDKEVLVDGSAFRVLGVFEKPKAGFGGDSDEDRRVVLPYWTFRKIYPAAEDHGFRVQAQPGQLDLMVDQVREVLRRQRNVKYNDPDNFSITTSQQVVEQFHEIVGMVALATIVLSSIGLLVGGVGVMNIMLVSVTERTREIGVRKAIGARRRDITWQFLFEAMTLTGVGGILGILLFGSIAMLIPRVTEMQAAVPLWAVVLGESVSVAIGLIFGVWPAMKAARLDPVEALRYE